MVDEWVPVNKLPQLGEDEVHVWRVDLPDESTPPEEYNHLLSPDELRRAERLRAGRVRLQFVVARAVLRTLLSDCLSREPKDVPITMTSFGKPQTPGVSFNVAHSGAAVLIALSRKHPVGVDVECFSRRVEALEIAKHSFTAAEYAALKSLADPEDQRRAFFQCWTRKEAVIKADGRGLSLALDSFEVPVGNAESPMIVSVNGETMAMKYYINDITCGGEVAAACATAAPHCTLEGFVFPLGMVAQKG